MWCPYFVMYNHKQLVIMKKVLMMLCAVLALASCSKEATEPQEQGQEQKKQQPKTPVSLSLSATISDLDAKALDHQLDGNKLKHFLNGKTELKVFTFIWDADAPRGSYLFSRELTWKVAEDGKTIYFDGNIDVYAAHLNPSTANIRLVAAIGQLPGSSGEVYPREEAAKPRLAGDQFPINTPCVLRTKLQLTSDRKLLYNTKQPEADRRFKPEGIFLRFKIRNELGTQVKITNLYYPRFDGNVYGFHYSYPELTVVQAANQAVKGLGNVFPSDYYNDPYDGKGIPLSQPIVLDPGKTTEAEFLYWMPTPYALIHPDVVLDDPGLLYHTTMQLQKQKLEDYEEGKVYRTTLVLRKLHNPLEYIAEYPMNATGTGMLTSLPAGYPHPAVSPNKFQPYAEVGYFNEREAKEKFGTPKKYPGGGDDVWHLPSEAELRSIFGSLGKDSGLGDWGTGGAYLSLVEWVQLGNYKTRIGSRYSCFRRDPHTVFAKRSLNGVNTLEPSGTPKTGFYTPLDPHQNLEEKYRRSFRTETPEFPLEISNRICFAFRYKLTANRTLEVTAKYVGFNEEDIRYLESQSESWWKDRNSVTRVFPAYSIEVNTYDYAATLYDYLSDLGGMRSNGSALSSTTTLSILIRRRSPHSPSAALGRSPSTSSAPSTTKEASPQWKRKNSTSAPSLKL